MLARKEFPGREAELTLDRISVKLAQDRGDEASKLAEGMAPLLFRFKDNRIAEGAVLELMRAAGEGRLSEGLVCEVRARIESERTREKGTLARR